MAYTDWIRIVEETIPNKNTLSILEFGLGEGTEYLLNTFKFVYSHEIIDQPFWYNKTLEKLGSFHNWQNKLVLFKDIEFKGENPNAHKIWYDNDEVLLYQLYKDTDELFKQYKFDIVFIDGEYHVRGDIANYVLNNYHPEYVIIHDTNYLWDTDHYNRIVLPNKYTPVKSTDGEGTVIFVKTI